MGTFPGVDLPFVLTPLALFYGQASLASVPPSTGVALNQAPGSESVAAASGAHSPDKYRYSVLQTRCARLEQDLRATHGVLAILRSKQPRPAEREAFLLEELEKANRDLLCKRPQAPEPLSASSRIFL